MELSAFLRLYADIEPLRTLARTYPTVNTTTLATLFLRPAANASAREALYHNLCTILQPPSRVDVYALRHLKLMWEQVAETNRILKRFCYSDAPMSEAETNTMWRIVESMQAEGGSIRECAAMVGIPQCSILRLQRAWQLLHDHTNEEGANRETMSNPFVSTADVPTPVASPQASPRASTLPVDVTTTEVVSRPAQASPQPMSPPVEVTTLVTSAQASPRAASLREVPPRSATPSLDQRLRSSPKRKTRNADDDEGDNKVGSPKKRSRVD